MFTRLINNTTGLFNLATGATIFTATADPSNPSLCYALIQMSGLTGSGNFTVNLQIDNYQLNGLGNQYYVGSGIASAIHTEGFTVPQNKQVSLYVKSPNGGDTSIFVDSLLTTPSGIVSVSGTSGGSSSGTAEFSFVVSAASVPEVNVANNLINIYRAVDWNFSVTGIGNNATDFYFTIKSNTANDDDIAELQMNTTGTTYVNNSGLSTTSGLLTYASGNGGTITVTAEPEITELIDEGKYAWDIKSIDPTEIRAFGSMKIKHTVTHRIG